MTWVPNPGGTATLTLKMTVEARVDGVTEIDSDLAKSGRYCIGF